VIGTQVSFKNTDVDSILVTGNNTYKYFEIRDNSSLRATYSQLSKKENNHLSSNYTAHCWLPEGKFLVGTDQGQIMLCLANGEFKGVLADSPGEGFYIETIRTYSKGFIIGGDQGKMMVFMSTGEVNNPYTRIASLPNP
jgi:hypothetical protein